MAADPKHPFDTAFAALLAPIAQAMLGQGITIGAASEAIKYALLQAALQEADGDIKKAYEVGHALPCCNPLPSAATMSHVAGVNTLMTPFSPCTPVFPT